MLQRLYRPLLSPLGLTYSQYLVMLVLWRREPVSVSELCECLHLDIGTLSPLLKRMEQTSFIERARDPTDDRRVLIGVTPYGRALRERALHIPEALARKTGMEHREVEDLRDQAQTLVARLATVFA
nr:MarR family transcriptional regulator [Azospirillum rugosum]